MQFTVLSLLACLAHAQVVLTSPYSLAQGTTGVAGPAGSSSKLFLNADGRLSYQVNGINTWISGPMKVIGAVGPYTMKLQQDGNMVVVDSNNMSIFSTRSGPSLGAALSPYKLSLMTNYAVIRDAKNNVVWQTDSELGKEAFTNGAAIKNAVTVSNKVCCLERYRPFMINNSGINSLKTRYRVLSDYCRQILPNQICPTSGFIPPPSADFYP